MKKFLLAVSLLAIAGTSVLAGPIEDRKAIMEANGKAAGALSAIVKGEKPFDAAVVMEALKTIKENSEKFDPVALFPVGTETGGETTASPKIWEDMAGFQAAAEKFKADAATAFANPPQDVEGVKSTLGALGSNCQACHQTYRVKKG